MKKIIGTFDFSKVEIVDSKLIYRASGKFRDVVSDQWIKLEAKVKENNGKLWNNDIYRLFRVENIDSKILLHLGLIDYKTHYATEFAGELLDRVPFEESPNGMYISAFIETKDGYLMFGERSSKCVTKNGTISLIGGILEPKEQVLKSGHDLLKSFIKELREEMGIKSKHVADYGLGMFLTDSHRVCVLLYIKLAESKNDLSELIHLNFEHKQVVFWSERELVKNIDLPEVHPNVKYMLGDLLDFKSRLLS